MNAVIAVMLLVSCTDNFSVCNASDDMVRVYPSHEVCETALIHEVKRIGSHSEQVFGKCVKADADFINGDLSIYWHVDQNGNLIVELANEDSGEDEISIALNEIDKSQANKVPIMKPNA
ncbi:hypothetical protein [uncultured Bartonella sp.]|uniref:hypothetical protein n=1 Tax=uncultured Bartonella sp. TaxID=104108 RepID=UPI00262215B5|nr:hypothetical protein [uncultured Bartonella sp.]